MVNSQSKSKTPSVRTTDPFIVFYLFVYIMSRVSKLVTFCLFYVAINNHYCFYFNIARDVVTILLIFVHVRHENYAFSQHAHVEAHTHKHTCGISAQGEL